MTTQLGATLAVGVKKQKSQKLKALLLSQRSFWDLVHHWTCYFGVNLRYGKPFIMGLIAGAAGGWFTRLLGLAGTSFGIWCSWYPLLYLNDQILQYIFMVLTTGLGFGLTYAFGYKDEEEVATEEETRVTFG